MTNADIAFATSSVVGLALVALSGAGISLRKRLSGNGILAHIGMASALLFPLLTGIALMSPLLASLTGRFLPNLPLPSGDVGQIFLLLAALTLPFAVTSVFFFVRTITGCHRLRTPRA